MVSNIEQIKIVRQIAKAVDKDGNGNNTIDGDEVSIFVEKLQSKGISDAGKFVKNYQNNKVYSENLFAKNGGTSDDSVENAIISQLNNDSYLNKNKKSKNSVNGILTGVHEAVEYFWGTDEEKLDKSVGMINKDNVMQVLNAEYSDDETFIQAIKGDVNQDYMDKYGKTIIGSLVALASEKQIDVTSIVAIGPNDTYLVGSDVAGAKIGESATDKDNIENVVNALKNAIDSSLDALTTKIDDKTSKTDVKSALLQYARQADSAANGGDENGHLNGKEVSVFKNACAQIGIVVNDILSSMYTKSKKEGELTEIESTIKSLFDADTNIIETAKVEKDLKNSTEAIKQAISDEDDEVLRQYLSTDNVNAENVEAILLALEKDSKYKNNIGNVLDDAFGSDAKEFNKVIISALYSKAEIENIDVSDIIIQSGEDFVITGTTDDAHDSEHANNVISKLRTRIKEELGE